MEDEMLRVYLLQYGLPGIRHFTAENRAYYNILKLQEKNRYLFGFGGKEQNMLFDWFNMPPRLNYGYSTAGDEIAVLMRNMLKRRSVFIENQDADVTRMLTICYLLETSLCNKARQVKGEYEDSWVTRNSTIINRFAKRDICDYKALDRDLEKQFVQGKMPVYEINIDVHRTVTVKMKTLTLKNTYLSPLTLMKNFILIALNDMCGAARMVTVCTADETYDLLFGTPAFQRLQDNIKVGMLHKVWDGHSSTLVLPRITTDKTNIVSHKENIYGIRRIIF